MYISRLQRAPQSSQGISEPVPLTAGDHGPILPPLRTGILRNDPLLEELDRPVLTERELEWGLIYEMHDELSKITMETCHRCNEQWFDLKIDRHGICARCQRVDKNQEIYLWEHQNEVQPSPMPPDLPDLTQVEEMLIARVHTYIEVHQI
ncbi:hypothetical protein N7456_005586 [Penicillium angulare]|uniref:DUF6570 domain-containing protein n=1 Tax=Penicillium angulare TaxID=116970 RepID=A0A9W9FYM7_9EURO|nr:hypothetical protein N7456_005586 [Penicillium angulare]